MGGSVYSTLAHRLARFEGEIFPLHIGDTWMEPPQGCWMEDVSVADHPGMHRYAPVQGLPGLIDAIVDRVSERTGPVEREQVLVTAGATGGLGAVMGGILSPGDEVLLLAPYWPLIAGIVRSMHGVPVAVPFFGEVDNAEAAVEALQGRRSERTVAVYVNTPNNPTGRVAAPEVLGAVAEWARAHGLYLVSDEVYEDYQYVGEHTYLRTLAPERTFSAWSFSKGFGMAGNRTGWVVGPTEQLDQMRKIAVHTFYSTPTASQIAGERCLRGLGAPWVVKASSAYNALGSYAAVRLGLEPPQGSTFLFMDVSPFLDNRGLMGFLSDCVDRGLLLAPGPSFGPYPTHVRVCFTSAAPQVVRRGVDVLAELIGRSSS